MKTQTITGLKVGYARVSTDDQNLALQLDALATAGCTQIYQEAASGKNTDRQELGYCLKALRPGDTLIVWRLDRLGRSLSDLVQMLNGLKDSGVFFESLTERIETSSATGQLIFHVFAALAEFERSLIRERTMAGLAAARARGRKGGRSPKLGEKEVTQLKAIYAAQTIPVGDLAKRYGISRSSLYNYISSAS